MVKTLGKKEQTQIRVRNGIIVNSTVRLGLIEKVALSKEGDARGSPADLWGKDVTNQNSQYQSPKAGEYLLAQGTAKWPVWLKPSE